MKKIQNTLLVVLLICFFNSQTAAQKKKYKFGKISPQELNMQFYENDSSASAVVLFDRGEVNFRYTNETGFNIEFTRHLRIKVFKKEGYKYARFDIPLGKSNNGDYKLSKIKATAYEVSKDNKLQKYKLENKNIYYEDINKYWEQVKFEVPNIKEGTIFEVEYTINKNSWRIPSWEFQQDIPVILSEYSIYIPEYFNYKKLQKGYLTINSDPIKNYRKTFSYEYEDDIPGSLGRKRIYSGTQEYSEVIHHLYAKNIPAFKSESYITCSKNYKSAINFELASFTPPYGTVKNYTQTWEAISKGLFENEDFGGQLKFGLFLNEFKNSLLEANTTDDEKLIKAVNYIKENIKWNEYNGIYAYHGIRKAFKEGNGNCADVNLALVCLLEKLNINAKPVILSTRNNGFIHPAQIMKDQFNYVIASAIINDKIYLIDATEPNLPIGMLPARCLNGQGRIINGKGGSWIDLTANSKSIRSYQLNLKLSESEVSGTAIEKHKGYAALNKRNAIQYHNSIEDYYTKVNEENSLISFDFDSTRFINQITKPIELYYSLESDGLIEKAGNLLMINPVIFERITTNPFKLEKREYPVDYTYPTTSNYMTTIELPSGYDVDFLPKPQKVLMPEKGASFLLSMQHIGNKIIVVSKLSINKVTFLPDEYEYLKQFYNQIIDAHSKQIILKKTS